MDEEILAYEQGIFEAFFSHRKEDGTRLTSVCNTFLHSRLLTFDFSGI